MAEVKRAASTAENKAIVQRYFEAMEGADVEVLVTLWADDALNDGQGRTVPAERRGLDRSRQVLRSLRTAFADRTWHIEDIIAEGDKVVCRLTVSGTHGGMTEAPIEGGFLTTFPPTGKSYSVMQIHLLRLAGGKIAEHWAARDDLGLLRQLGMIRARAGVGVEALHLEAPERTQFEAAARRGSLATLGSTARNNVPGAGPLLHNLPVPVTSFVGRERELADVTRLLADTRLLTLTGSGGVGKTRLALKVVAELVDAYPDGVWLVQLAPRANPSLVPDAVATALDVREVPGQAVLATLGDVLRRRMLLLILDNCEHLLDACAQLADALLQSCAHVRILATSREMLGIRGETTWRVPSLEWPDFGSDTPLEELRQNEAVRLFVDRAQAVVPDFAATRENAGPLARVCQRLDGIPLAIELAAARVRVLTVEQIATRLDDRFQLLTGGSRTAFRRQQTLRALIDWSHDLLSQTEQTLFRRLAVFAGGWTVEAVEAVGVGDGVASAEVLDLLTALVDKSLVISEDQAGAERYRLLETIRAYAQDALAASGDLAAVRGHHAAHYLALAERAARKIRTSRWGAPAAMPESPPGSESTTRVRGPTGWLGILESEHANLRVGLAWCADAGAAEEGLRLAGSLWEFWYTRGLMSEGKLWLERLLILPGAAAATRAWALWMAGEFTCYLGQPEEAAPLHRQAAALARAAGDQRTLAEALSVLGEIACRQGELAKARALLEEEMALRQELGDPRRTRLVLGKRGHLALAAGDLIGARALFEELLTYGRASENRLGVAGALEWLGNIALAREDTVASAFYSESLTTFREIGDRLGEAHALQGLGLAALAQSDPLTAQTWLRQCLALQRKIGDMMWRAGTFAGLAAVDAARLGDDASPPIAAQRALRMGGVASTARRNPYYSGPLRLPAVARWLERCLASAREILGEQAAEEAMGQGQAMTPEEAIAYALDEVGA